MRENVIALGFFDGVHLGHQSILRAAVSLAAEKGLRPIAVTFLDQPRAFLMGEPSRLVTSRRDRERFILENGIERVEMLPFNGALASMRPEDFAAMLAEKYSCAAAVCGENYTFGAGGAGNGALLTELGRKCGFQCLVCPPVVREGRVVSSTWLRELVEAGDMATLARLMGRRYEISGTVIHGRAVGRGLGVPTGNFPFPEGLVTPENGVYAGWAAVGDERLPCAVNIGLRPTFGLEGEGVMVEFHLLSGGRDLYGKTAALTLERFIRPEMAFPSPEVLREQIRRDEDEVREVLSLC